jgi:hypothetical protein
MITAIRSRWVQMLAIVLAGNLLAQFVRGIMGWDVNDFRAFWTGGAQLASGHPLYDATTQLQLQAAAFPVARDPSRFTAFVSPPPVAVAFRPFANLPTWVAAVAFEVAVVVAIVVAARALWCLYPNRWVILTLIALPMGADSLWLMQMDYFAFAAGAVSVLALYRGRAFVAGLLLAGMMVKPQLVWLVPVAALTAGQWRLLAGMMAGIALGVVVSVLAGGPSSLSSWLHLANAIDTAQVFFGASLPSAFMGIDPMAFIVAGVVAALAAGWLLRRDPMLMVGVALTLSLLFTTHLFRGDYLVVGIPLVIWARRSDVQAMVTAVAFTFVSLVAPPTGDRGAYWLSLLTVGLLLALGVRELPQRWPFA